MPILRVSPVKFFSVFFDFKLDLYYYYFLLNNYENLRLFSFGLIFGNIALLWEKCLCYLVRFFFISIYDSPDIVIAIFWAINGV